MAKPKRKPIRIERISSLHPYFDQLPEIHQQMLSNGNATKEANAYERFISSLAEACANAHVFAIIDTGTGLIQAISVVTIIRRPFETEYYREDWFIHGDTLLTTVERLYKKIRSIMFTTYDPARIFVRTRDSTIGAETADELLRVETLH